MTRGPARSTRIDTLFPDTTLVRAPEVTVGRERRGGGPPLPGTTRPRTAGRRSGGRAGAGAAGGAARRHRGGASVADRRRPGADRPPADRKSTRLNSSP